MRWLLHLPSWRLFFVATVVPVLIGATIAGGFTHWNRVVVGPIDLLNHYLLRVLATGGYITLSLYFIVLFAWQLQAGTTLARRIPGNEKASLLSFKLSVILPPLLFLLNIAYDFFIYPSLSADFPNDTGWEASIHLILAALFLVSWIVCLSFRYLHLIKVIRRISKSFRQELIFLMLFFWPVGLWFLQPRIRAYCEKQGYPGILDHIVE